MKSFTLISGILITLLGVFFFANPTNLLAIVGWLFALDVYKRQILVLMRTIVKKKSSYEN